MNITRHGGVLRLKRGRHPMGKIQRLLQRAKQFFDTAGLTDQEFAGIGPMLRQ